MATSVRISTPLRSEVPTSPRKLPKQERSRATVEALLAATARVLAREGYQKASTNRVAEVSGNGIGFLYEYFPNKESLVATLIGRHAEEMLTLFEAWSEEHTGQRAFRGQVLVVWAPEDRIMAPEHGRRLAELFPNGRLVEIQDSYTLIPEDQPAKLTARIREFVPSQPTTVS